MASKVCAAIGKLSGFHNHRRLPTEYATDSTYALETSNVTFLGMHDAYFQL
jgi:hypothetical protein